MAGRRRCGADLDVDPNEVREPSRVAISAPRQSQQVKIGSTVLSGLPRKVTDQVVESILFSE